MKSKVSNRVSGLKLASIAAAALLVGTAQAVPKIDFGVAKGFSALNLGKVDQANDIEDRMAVGSNLTESGLSMNYRTPADHQRPGAGGRL